MSTDAPSAIETAEYAHARQADWAAFAGREGPPTDYWSRWAEQSYEWKQAVEFMQPVGIDAPGIFEALRPLLDRLEGMEEVDLIPQAFMRLVTLRLGYLMSTDIYWSQVETFYVGAAPRIHRVEPFKLRFSGISAREDSLYLGVDDGGTLREVRRQIRLGVPKAAEALKAEGITHGSPDPFVPSVDIAHFTGKGHRRRVVEAVTPFLDTVCGEYLVTQIKMGRIASDPFIHYPDLDVIAEIALLGQDYRKGYHN